MTLLYFYIFVQYIVFFLNITNGVVDSTTSLTYSRELEKITANATITDGVIDISYYRYIF